MLAVIETVDSYRKIELMLATERCLKSTGLRPKMMMNPTDSVIGRQIWMTVNNPMLPIPPESELLMVSAAFTQFAQLELYEALKFNEVVVVDKWYWYLITHFNYRHGIKRPVVDSIAKLCTKGIEAKLNIFVKVKPEVALVAKKMTAAKNERVDTLSLEQYRRVYNGYNGIAQRNSKTWKIVGSGTEINPDKLGELCALEVIRLLSR